MEEYKQLFCQVMTIDLHMAVFGGPKAKEGPQKVKVRPVLNKGTLFFQFERFENNQAFHENVVPEQAPKKAYMYMEQFRQCQITAGQVLYTVLTSKKGKISIIRKKQKSEDAKPVLTHNREKRYLLEEGRPIPFLVDLGVMSKDGNVVKSRFDKFRQINRFLEFIEDVLPEFPKDRELTILDFGCGKSYLTFAMYYYLHVLSGYEVKMIGLDLKKDVIRHCNELSEKYGYEKLRFLEGNIADYTGEEKVDMVVTLHACDTATDFALAKAVGWDAKVILSVPCCQHELNGQIHNELLEPVFRYGLIKERVAALLTDALRAEYLRKEGYEAQILEFIDMEHTPKNILIRAVKKGRKKNEGKQMEECIEFFHVEPMLGKLLALKGDD